MKVTRLIIIYCFFMITAYGKSNETVSIIIPCVPRHAHHLYALLKEYTQQTVLPEEVIIAISEAQHPDAVRLLKIIEATPWPFRVDVARTPKKMGPGNNRNHGFNHARGSILIFQDADDIPHKQRVEIVKYIFTSQKKIMFLMHYFLPHHEGEDPTQKFVHYTKERVTTQLITNANNFMSGPPSPTNGNICIRREVLQKLRWPSLMVGEDVTFNKSVLNMYFGKMVIAHAYLLLYRQYLSSSIPQAHTSLPAFA